MAKGGGAAQFLDAAPVGRGCGPASTAGNGGALRSGPVQVAADSCRSGTLLDEWSDAEKYNSTFQFAASKIALRGIRGQGSGIGRGARRRRTARRDADHDGVGLASDGRS